MSGLAVSSADILRLILAHLTDVGLHETVRMLHRESGVGLAGSVHGTRGGSSARNNGKDNDNGSQWWYQNAARGQWASILQGLSVLDRRRSPSWQPTTNRSSHTGIPQSSSSSAWVIPPSLVAGVHELTILELADAGDWPLAYALFRLVQQDEALATAASDMKYDNHHDNNKKKSSASNAKKAKEQRSHDGVTTTTTVHRALEQKLAALAADRAKDAACAVPDGYYGSNDDDDNDGTADQAKQAHRERLGRELQAAIPHQPRQRLPDLLQQAIQWQSYAGQLPRIRQWWDMDDHDNIGDDNEEDGVTKKSKKRKRPAKQFDLVLGEVSVDTVAVRDVTGSNDPSASSSRHGHQRQSPVRHDAAAIKFGKGATCEAACFLPDGTGLVTGSSDGFVEVYDSTHGTLRQDLPYQKDDESSGGALSHDTGSAISALVVSNDTTLLASGAADGGVQVWSVATGQCLRRFDSSTPASATVAASGVSGLAFSPHGSHVLVASRDGTCREFGLRTSRLLKEFRGHSSFLTACGYHIGSLSSSSSSTDDHDETTAEDDSRLWVLTASGDGTIRIWHGRTAELWRIWQPVSMGLRSQWSTLGTSIVVAASDMAGSGSPTVHTILTLHTPADTVLVVPRGARAFLVGWDGTVVQTYDSAVSTTTTSAATTEPPVFVAATVSTSNQWLYAVQDDGVCVVYDVATGERETMIADFASTSTSSRSGGSGGSVEISSLVHHPNKDYLAAFSSDNGQKKGKLMLWSK